MNSDPKYIPKSPDEILQDFRRYIDQMQPRLPELFGVLPKTPLKLEAAPASQPNAAFRYVPGTPDGVRPGRVLVGTSNVAQRKLFGDETVAYHEGIPGHHMQVSIQQLTGLPEFRLYLINSSLCRRLGPLRGDVRQGDRIFPGPGLGLRTSLSGAPTGSSSRRRHRHSLARLDPRGGIG